LIAVGVAVGPVLVTAPAQAADHGLEIASFDVGSPVKRTGEVRARVVLTAPVGSGVDYSVAKPAKGSATITSRGVLTYTPTAKARHAAAKDGATTAERTDLIRVTVADAAGQRDSKKVRVPILAANQAPVITGVEVGQPDPTTGVVKGRIKVTDPDGDPLTFQVTSDTSTVSTKRSITVDGTRARAMHLVDAPSPSTGVVTGLVCPSSQGSLGMSDTGQFTYTPTATSVSTATSADNFTVTVTDGYGGVTSVPLSVPTGSYGGGIQ
jgi:VCBS repeat-containing protein